MINTIQPKQHGVFSIDIKHEKYSKIVTKFLAHIKKTKFIITKTDTTIITDPNTGNVITYLNYYYEKR